MKITPIEIRQHTFEKGLRGYKPEDVDSFLISLSQEWERVTNDYKMLKMQLELAEKELGKLKEVEMTLFRTLKTAEDTSTQITEQANKAAEQYLGEARQKADDLLADARKRSVLMVQDAENQSRFLKDNILNDLKVIENDFKALEGYKESLTTQIRQMANNAIDSVDRFEKKFAQQDLKGKIDEVVEQITVDKEQAASLNKPDYEAPVAALPAPDPVDDLPPLTERETSIPESIPVTNSSGSEPPEEKLESTDPETSLDQTQTAPESVLAEVNTSDVTEDPKSESTPEPAPAPQRGGSFFDQI
ncbi:DivIVA domain-containing protein [Spirosoma sp. KUDC1026]|uniref:DivIVA domain-containing protein n=1 Tax=Spirosoma sp. KUDC1026 TaxID=2745947 RepID=UPI00159BA9DF|nr:DivIVA domain-containing protein [Spirosoma sp. KUDC1026]QKZ12100.1 DivIVA domain-containing protein [Spirosoma sp. KUDC1026]